MQNEQRKVNRLDAFLFVAIIASHFALIVVLLYLINN